MTDLVLIFPPQWSPFQPALALPSLSSWLKRAGYSVRSVDLNVLFYDWLISDEGAEILSTLADRSDLTETEKLAFSTVFSNAGDFRRALQDWKSSNFRGTADHLSQHYLAIRSMETYLHAVSTLSGQFELSLYGFDLVDGQPAQRKLEELIVSPPPVIAQFVDHFICHAICGEEAKLIGISCIGQQQLYFTLYLGAVLKARLDVPVMVGGTIIPRISERGELPAEWFGKYFDIVVQNEGEIPAERLLSNAMACRPLTLDVPSIIYCDNGIVSTSSPAPPLAPARVPIPDFDDMPLDKYFSAEVALPVLSSRGCYWGKCEFCHHGMVYGDRYSGYPVQQVFDTVESLSSRYGVRHFVFTDEAIPPKIVRAMGLQFPSHEKSGWNFTGLIKFERLYDEMDFGRLHKIGFRSLYVGLESASEYVLRLMKKENSIETIEGNLRDATAAGIWMHCFLFFGFPGEREEDARQTYEFVLSHSDIISSFGVDTFALEHNAPIYHHMENFGVKLRWAWEEKISVYYRYAVDTGIGPTQAVEWKERLDVAAKGIPRYRAATWVPRDSQLHLLSVMPPEELIAKSIAIEDFAGMPRNARLAEIVSFVPDPRRLGRRILLNRTNGNLLLLSESAGQVLDHFLRSGFSIGQVAKLAPVLFVKLAGTTLGEHPDVAKQAKGSVSG